MPPMAIRIRPSSPLRSGKPVLARCAGAAAMPAGAGAWFGLVVWAPWTDDFTVLNCWHFTPALPLFGSPLPAPPQALALAPRSFVPPGPLLGPKLALFWPSTTAMLPLEFAPLLGPGT